MLEIKDLTKVYKTKGGAEVRALDGVSLKFEEKGMVFLLGKSGSGKSTLLNLCGGLDSPDSGEIIIKGRSSKDFTQSDFDSYRNTFIGFVFQEYNILDEFTVADNIALALELQSRGRDRALVDEILKKVELQNFARRKPNTLSGGQKQRVAIARALVKDPEIIMADEPTGALDSATGKQVFETLKKLSEEKLVIVVSHDREFAEVYGDRIIELKDGKVISDVTKTKIPAGNAGENVSFSGGDIINIKSGSALTDGEMAKIADFLRSSEGGVIISNGKREIADFKKAARIDDSGARETFKTTADEDIKVRQYKKEEGNFIRSRLPARHAVRIGASGLKAKPFRLFFTVLLSTVAFTLFGLFSTLTFYDRVQTAVNTYADYSADYISMRKAYAYEDIYYENGEAEYSYNGTNYTLFTPADRDYYAELYGDKTLAVYNYDDASFVNLTFKNVGNPAAGYYDTTVNSFAEFDPAAWQGEMLTEGDISDLGDDEIIISSYTFESIRDGGLYSADGQREIVLNNYSDIVGQTLMLGTRNGYGNSEVALTVAGVYDNNLPDISKYENVGKPGYEMLATEFSNELAYGFYQCLLVSDSFYDAHLSDFSYRRSDLHFEYLNNSIKASASFYGEDGRTLYFNSASTLTPSEGKLPEMVYFGGASAISDGQMVVPYAWLDGYVQDLVNNKAGLLNEQAAEAYDRGDSEEGDRLSAEAKELYERYYLCNDIFINGCVNVNDDEGNWFMREPTEEEMASCKQLVADMLSGAEGGYEALTVECYLGESSVKYGDWKIVGYYIQPFNTYSSDGCYLSDGDFDKIMRDTQSGIYGDYYNVQKTKYVVPEDAKYNKLVVSKPADTGLLTGLISSAGVVADDDSLFELYSPVENGLRYADSMIEMLGQVFLWVGLVMALFSMLLLFNFISVSISYKKKEIGILRAVGARSADVFKIFYSESVIITAICFVLAMVLSFVVCDILNAEVAGALGATIFVFGPLSWLVMLGIAAATSFIATFLPVYSIARRKPVESIRAL